jgi:hypothetical protein
MLSYLLLLSLINLIVAFEPSCVSCKQFIPIHNNKGNNDLGLCKMFKNTCYNSKGKEVIIHNFAAHCRNDENLCGKSGFLYEAKNEDSEDVSETETENDLNELNNRCCGEVNEKDEIEQLERDFFEIFQRIKKFNKKRIYSTSKDLYKLFKRND